MMCCVDPAADDCRCLCSCARVFNTVAYITETAVFLSTLNCAAASLTQTVISLAFVADLGLTVFALRTGYTFSFIIWTAMFCLIGRACHVYPLTTLVNLGRKSNPITRNQQHMIWFSGLRGAVAFALAKSFPGEKQNEIIATTMIIILASIFIMGGGTVAMLRILDIPRLTVRSFLDAPSECDEDLDMLTALCFCVLSRKKRWR
ncbi:hypothetical protein PINS_up008091 [Pythium insidiosum]|nr:hypothetical protein PINS_up008091 [Pythium insidiosum]